MPDFSRRVFMGAVSSICITQAAFAQPSLQKAEYRIFDNPPDSHTLSHFDVTIDDRDYRLFMAIPKTGTPTKGWPSIWMLDGNAVFDRLTRDDLARYPGLALIGVGYPVEQSFDGVARALDYTPRSPIPDQRQRNPTGGADAFRARLLGSLREEVEVKMRLNPERRMLWGHSYGGLFTLYCLLTEPDAFNAWVAASPSSSFGGNALQTYIPDALRLPEATELLILLGNSEHRRDAAPRPSPETMAIAGMLRGRSDLDMQVTVLKGLGHGATFTASFSAAFDLAVKD